MANPARNPDSETASGRVADAVEGSWVDGIAPPWARPYLRLSRADRPIGTWLLLLPCWWALFLALAAPSADSGPSAAWILAACAAGAALMRGAGCCWNDLVDRDLDAAVSRTRSRPLPSGQVRVRQAIIWMLVQALAAFGILLTLGDAAIALGLLSLLPVAVYPFAKRFTRWPQLFLGMAFNWGAVLAWAAETGSLSAAPLLLYLSGIAWTLFYDTIYAHQDREDDALLGIGSTALLLGARTKPWLAGFAIAATLSMAASAAVALADSPPLRLTCALAGVAAFGWHLARQLFRLDIDSRDGCLELFRSNRNAGLLPLPFFALATLNI